VKPDDVIDLLDWKRRVFSLYAAIRGAEDREGAWRRWRAERDEMFRTHPQSPLPEAARDPFAGLPYFDYDPAFQVDAELLHAGAQTYEIGTSGGTTMTFTRFATVRLELVGHPVELEVYWLATYGGGVFLPFRDATCGAETYGAGRYLLDTVKGADLGSGDGYLSLDFNFAYNPSCAYDPSWVCPLAPPANRLDVPVRAGERFEN
jgi:uncharacterized protein